MLWVVVLLLVLVLLLIGALLTLTLGRILPKRGGLLVAALPLFLAIVVIVVMVPLIRPDQDLAETISPPSPGVALQIAPTAQWVQPPRTLVFPTVVTPTATPTPTPDRAFTPSPTPHPYSLVTIVVRNGTGETGLATGTSKRLAQQGFRVLSPEDDPQQGSRPHTLILDRGDHPEVRNALVEFLNVAAEYVQINSVETSGGDIVVIIGDDFNQLANTTPAPTPTLVGGPTATPNPYAGVTFLIRNGTVGRAGLATRTADRLKAQGFIVLDTEDDQRAGERPHTLILDRGDHTAVRDALVQFLKVDPAYVEVNSPVSAEADIIIILGDDFQE
jgi:hypothetical protein